MKKNRVFAVGALLLTGLAAWLGAQQSAPTKPASEFMPAGALFYVEARNFSKLKSDWDASPEKKAWLTSPNYQSFERSHLLTRLIEARKGFTDAAGVAEDAALLNGVAGGESAIGFYHIGKLEFLYITQIPSSRFADSAIAKVKQKFQARKAAGHDYFVLAKGDNTIAFALVDDRLLLATREDLVANSLKLFAGEKMGTLGGERWFTEALSKAPGGSPDVRFVADLQRTSRTPQFRSYWIHDNLTEVRQFASEVADLTMNASDIREERVFLRQQAQESTMTASEPAVAELLRYATPGAGFYQAIAKPAPSDVAEMLAQKLFGHGRALERQSHNKTAPDEPPGPSLSGEDDYETHIDTPQFTSDPVDAFGPLNVLAANTDAILQTGVAVVNSVLPGLESAVVLHGGAPWRVDEVKRILGEIAGVIWSPSEWTDRNGYSELNSITPLRVAVEGNNLIVSSSPEWMARVMSTRRSAPGAGASYSASFQFGRELPGFTRMMKLMDFPAIPPGQATDAAREPLFFSENLSSLAGAMVRLHSATITSHDTGATVTESLVYRKK